MAKFLAIQIRMGEITLDDVPEKYLEAVKAELGIED